MVGWVGCWVGGRNLIIKTISAELDCAELGKMNRYSTLVLINTMKLVHLQVLMLKLSTMWKKS